MRSVRSLELSSELDIVLLATRHSDTAAANRFRLHDIKPDPLAVLSAKFLTRIVQTA
jgi:hypothetical protein